MRKLSMQELGRPTREQFLQHKKHQVVLVLDNIRSGLNVGSIFRTADAFAIEKLILCGITPRPPHREILKTSLGATETVHWEHVEDTVQACENLRDNGYHIWPVEQTDSSITLDALPAGTGTPEAFVFGNEVNGISAAVLDILDQSIEIPQYGTKHSLNVAVSVGVVLWHVLFGNSHRIGQD